VGVRGVGRRRRPLVVAVVLALLVVTGGVLISGRGHPTEAATAPTTTTPPTGSATPSAADPSSPAASASAPVQVVALGDSVTAGTACGCTSFPTLYQRGLADRTGLEVKLDDRGEAGDTTSDVLDDLASPDGSSSVADADVVLVTIGANDFADVADDVENGRCGSDVACAQDDLDALRTHLTSLVSTIRTLRDGRPTAVLVTGYWNVFEDGDVADQDYTKAGTAETDTLTRQVNAVEQSVAEAGGGTYVDLYAPFKGEAGEKDPTDLLADDGDHPNAAGHQLIAQALLQAGTAPLDLS
jgi:lysophospholipase L1-like esterase